MECLVAKLKVSFNNPNLPVLDKINDFTIAAIAASGNESMTSDQIESLDNFFKNLGAFENSGIWAKMDIMVIPMLAGGLDKTLVDYKNNTVLFTPTSTNYSFTGKSLMYIGSAAGFNINYSTTYTRQYSNMSYVAVLSIGESYQSEVIRQASLQNTFGQSFSSSLNKPIIRISGLYSGFDKYAKIFGATIANGIPIFKQIINDNIITQNTANGTISPNEESQYTARLRFAKDVGEKLITCGDTLTDAELDTLLAEASKLDAAFSV